VTQRIDEQRKRLAAQFMQAVRTLSEGLRQEVMRYSVRRDYDR